MQACGIQKLSETAGSVGHTQFALPIQKKLRRFEPHAPVQSTPLGRTQRLSAVAEAFGVIKTAISVSASVGILASLVKSAAPVVASRQALQRPGQSSNGDDVNGIKWGAMSVLSCLPLFNWLAWVFAALENEERASFYYLLAGLYAVPQLSVGFQQDWLSIATLLAGIAHVQAERVAEERGVAQKVDVDLTGGFEPQRIVKALTDSTRSLADAVKGGTESGADEAAEKPGEDMASADEELKRWDTLFDSRRSEEKQERR